MKSSNLCDVRTYLSPRLFAALTTLFLLLILIGSSASVQAGQRFAGTLTGAQETPPNGSAGTGYGSVVLSDDQTMITVNLGFTGLGSNATAGHIHFGAPGVAGPIVFGFTGVPSATSGVIPQQTFLVTPAQVVDFQAGNFYFNIHSVTLGGGEIRAQIGAPSCATAGPIEVEATAGTFGPTAYATLKLAFDAINAGTHQGVVDIGVCTDTTETVPAVLNANGSGAALYSGISIQPSGGAAKTISGAISAGSPLIDLNGADNVIIDGLNTGGNSLTIANTTASATSGTATIRFIGGATTNTITNCNLQGSVSSSVATNGAIIFFSTDAVTANGNDNNTISKNNIGPAAANLPTKAIQGNGSTTTTAIGNSGEIIDNNNIFDFFGAAVTSSGVSTNGGCNTWQITNNRFYQTGTRTWTTGALHTAINIANTTATSGAQAFTITGNIIGFASNTQTGTYTLTGSVTGTRFVGIFFNGIVTGATTTVSNNTVASVSMTGVLGSGTSTGSPFMGIFFQEGNGITNNNTVGSQSATGSLTFSTTTTASTDVYGIYNFSSNAWTSNTNNVGGISVTNLGASGTFLMFGMRNFTTSTTPWTATSNNVGGTVANSIQLTATGTASQVVGMFTSICPLLLTSNTIRNLTTNIGTGTTTGASVIGISQTTATPSSTLSQNTIFNLTNTNAAAASVVTGISFTGGPSNVIERNLIYGITAATTSATAEVNGIRVVGGTTVYRNNMIAVGAGIANAIQVNGITEPAGTDSFFHNSVYIGGSPTAGAANSFAFNSTVVTNTRSFRDNIFFNARSNSGATGKNYSVQVGGTTPNPAGLTINNNVYFANGSGAVFGRFNALDVADLTAWKAAVGQDASSLSSDPQYLDPTNATPNLHINPAVTTVIEGNGADVGVIVDFDGQTRSTLTPVDIGADAGNFMGIDLVPPAISYTPLGNGADLSTRSLTGVVIVDNSGVNVAPGTKPRLYYKKSTDTNDLAATGWKFVEANGATSPFDFTIIYAALNGGSVSAGDTIQYFVVAQDLAATPNVGINSGTFAVQPTSVALTGTAFPIGGTIRSYLIVPPISGAKTICASGCDFSGITTAGGLFATINGSALTGNVIATVTGDLTLEDGTNALNQMSEDPVSNFTLTIQPSGPRTVLGTNTTALINLNGADRVTINGLNTGGNSLLIRNTSLTTGQVIQLISDASNNSIANCTIQGGNTSTSGALILIAAGTTTGNDNNSITNNIIRDRTDVAGVPANSVASLNGSTTATNSFNVISNNQIINFINNGIATSSGATSDNWTINNNDISQNATRASNTFAINTGGMTGTNTISGNSIHGFVSSGTNAILGFLVGNSLNLTVSRNRIYDFQTTAGATGVIEGLEFDGASGGAANITVVNNMVTLAPTLATAQAVIGIQDFGFGGNTFTANHNSVYVGGTASGAAPSWAMKRGDLAPTTYTARNNIAFNNRTGGTGNHFAGGDDSANTGTFVSNFNFFAGTGATPANFMDYGTASGGTPVSFAAWQTGPPARDANSTAGLASSFVVSNIFVDVATGDLHIKPTAGVIVSGGTPVAGVTTDFDNDPRPAANPDIGADELVQAVGGVIPAGTLYNASSVGGDSLGGNVTITNSLYLAGPLSTGANTLTIDCNGSVIGAGPGSYVIGNLARNFCATGSKVFDVGTANGYSPFTANATAGAFPSTLTASAVQVPHPSVNPSTSIQRYWILTESGDITADLTFQYLGTDVLGNEALYKVIRVIGGTAVAFPASVVTPATHIATLSGVSSFSDWTVGQISAPTAAPATISGIVTRADGSPLGGVTVNLSNGRRTFTGGNGQYRFDNVETDGFYVVTPGMANYTFSPASRAFTLLGNRTDATFTANATAPRENPLDGGDFFVWQQYRDFLERDPDPAGWLYWTGQLSSCGQDQHCIREKRIDISKAFFDSVEFGQSGGFIYRLYRAGLGRQLTYAEFTDDHQKVIGGADLDSLRDQFAGTFVKRSEFMAKYQNAVLAETFVDALLQTTLVEAQVDLSSQREALIAAYNRASNSGGDMNDSRSAVLSAVADDSAFKTAVYNPSFVLMEYFGYLQREMEPEGFAFWVGVLNNGDPGNYRGMVCSFLTSAEYQRRFSSIVTHNNSECGR